MATKRQRELALHLRNIDIELEELKDERKRVRDKLNKSMKVGDEILVVDHGTLMKVESETAVFDDMKRLKRMIDDEDFMKVIKASVSDLRKLKGDEWVEAYCDGFKKSQYVMWDRDRFGR